MRSAANFLAEIADGINFYLFAVLVVEDTDCALRFRFVNGHFFAHDGDILFDLFVDKVFNRFYFVRRHCTVETEVEP